MPDINANLGRQLQVARKERHLRQADLAEAAGVDRTTVIRAERGGHVQAPTLVKLVQALGLQSDHLEPKPDHVEHHAVSSSPYERACAYLLALPPAAQESALEFLLRQWHPMYFGGKSETVDVRDGHYGPDGRRR